MKISIFILSLLLCFSCSNEKIVETEIPIVETEIPVREKIEFNIKLGYLQKHSFSSTTDIFYILNSINEIDSLESLNTSSREFMKTYFSNFNFSDSTLIGITLVQIYSSSTNVYIDSLIQENDTIKIYWDVDYTSIYQDITSPSEIISIEKSDKQIILIDNSLFNKHRIIRGSSLAALSLGGGSSSMPFYH